MRRHRWFAGGAVVATVVTLVGCAVPTDDEFRVIAPKDAPYAIETSVVPETTAIPDETIAPLAVYLVGLLRHAGTGKRPRRAFDLWRTRPADVTGRGDGRLVAVGGPGRIDRRRHRDGTVDGEHRSRPHVRRSSRGGTAPRDRPDRADRIRSGANDPGGLLDRRRGDRGARGDSSLGGGAVRRADYESLLAPPA